MFPEVTLALSLLVLIGMLLYRVDALRLHDDQDEIKNKLPEVKMVAHIKRGIDSVIYFVGIRIWRLIRTIKKRFKKN